MTKLSLLRIYLPVLFIILFLNVSVSHAQSKIDLGKDTLSKAEVMGMRDTYVNEIRGKGQRATERIILPVNKLKEIMDKCDANNISEVKVFIISLRPGDLAKFRRNNPGTDANDTQLKGLQLLVFKVPRRAFTGAAGSKINSTNNNPLMLSLLSAGLVRLNSTYSDLPGGDDDFFFTFGGICPPPGACD